jgi:small subunit ribosomal protein S16
LLKIRLTRTGKTNQESFRIVVAEHTNAVKGKYTELLGHYQPAKNPKLFDMKKERIEYWISKGAQPSGTVASLLKRHGFSNMDKYLVVRTTKTKKKGAAAESQAKPAEPKKEETPQ